MFSLISSIGMCLQGSRSMFNNGLIEESINADAKISKEPLKINA